MIFVIVPQPKQQPYPGPRGFLSFFIGKFCDNCFLFFFYWHEALRSALHVANFQMKKDNIKREPLGPGYSNPGYTLDTQIYVKQN